MDVNEAASFLGICILGSLGCTMVCIALIFINNIFVKYWKPVQLFKYQPYPELPEFNEPIVDPKKTTKIKK